MGCEMNREFRVVKQTPDKAALIRALKKVKGAIPYDGDASVQVLLPQKDGGTLRVGVTDDDVSDGELWFDNYRGLFGEIPQKG